MAYLTKQTKIKVAGIIALCLVVVVGLSSLFCCSPMGFYEPPVSPIAPSSPAAPSPTSANKKSSDATENAYSFDADDVEKITVAWAAGSAYVHTADIETIEVREISSGRSRSVPMDCRLNGTTLEINYATHAIGLVGCAFNFGSKQLEICIPSSMNDSLQLFALDAASGTYRFDGLSAQTLDVTLASGEVDVQDVQATDLLLDIASGSVQVAGNVGRINSNSASGKVNVTCVDSLKQANISLASGQFKLVLPKESNFTVDLDKVAGSLAVTGFDCMQQDNRWICGSGESPIAIDIVSGSVDICAQ